MSDITLHSFAVLGLLTVCYWIAEWAVRTLTNRKHKA